MRSACWHWACGRQRRRAAPLVDTLRADPVRCFAQDDQRMADISVESNPSFRSCFRRLNAMASLRSASEVGSLLKTASSSPSATCGAGGHAGGSFAKEFGFVSTGFNLDGMVAPRLYACLMDRGPAADDLRHRHCLHPPGALARHHEPQTAGCRMDSMRSIAIADKETALAPPRRRHPAGRTLERDPRRRRGEGRVLECHRLSGRGRSAAGVAEAGLEGTAKA